MAKVKVYVTLKPTLLDAQGQVVANALQNLGYNNVEEVRVGKFIEIELSENGKSVQEQVDEMCRRLLANPNIENYKFEIA